MQVAQTILEQLGGNRFIVMTGANTFVGSENSLRFRIPRNQSGANVCTITLEANDLYRVEFIAVRGVKVTTKRQAEMIYADNLRALFTETTGFYTSL